MTSDVPEMKLLMSVDKRFFRKAARKSTSKCASREYTSHAFSLMWSVLRGHAQKDVFKAAMFEQKKIEKTTSDVPEMKLFKLFIIGLKKKCNGEAALCWSHFIFFPEKQVRYNII